MPARESPKRARHHVSAVTVEHIRYEVVGGTRSRGFKQNGGVIAAIEIASGKELWTQLVYTTVYDDREESDVQDVFITAMQLSPDGCALLITNEAGRHFMLNLADRIVAESP